MAQTLGRKRFPAQWTIGTALAAVVLIGTLIGGVALREYDNRRAGETQAVAPALINYTPGLSEGLLDLQLEQAVAVRTHYASSRSEGLLDLQLEQAVATQAHYASSHGEGLLDLQLQQAVQAERASPGSPAPAEHD